MATPKINGRIVAVLATDGFEQSELLEPLKAIRDAGATAHVVAPAKTMQAGTIRGWSGADWADSVGVDKTLNDASANDYDALVLPGGVMNPDQLRQDTDAIDFVRRFFVDGKPVAAICHGAQTLIECDVLQGRELTSYPAIKTDLKNAGARWVDREVVCDQGLVTSRTPKDLKAFIAKTLEEIAEGKHARQRTA
jgi:protease I